MPVVEHEKGISNPADWPGELNLRVWVVREEEGVYGALAEDFAIAGMGDTPMAAWVNMSELLEDYLDVCREDQLPWNQVVRRSSLRERARLRRLLLWAHLHRARRGLRDAVRSESVHTRLDEQGLHALNYC